MCLNQFRFEGFCNSAIYCIWQVVLTRVSKTTSSQIWLKTLKGILLTLRFVDQHEYPYCYIWKQILFLRCHFFGSFEHGKLNSRDLLYCCDVNKPPSEKIYVLLVNVAIYDPFYDHLKPMIVWTNNGLFIFVALCISVEDKQIELVCLKLTFNLVMELQPIIILLMFHLFDHFGESHVSLSFPSKHKRCSW